MNTSLYIFIKSGDTVMTPSVEMGVTEKVSIEMAADKGVDAMALYFAPFNLYAVKEQIISTAKDMKTLSDVRFIEHNTLCIILILDKPNIPFNEIIEKYKLGKEVNSGLRPTLSGGALDTLHKFFWHGPQEPGDIPSKAGEAELREQGYVRRHTFEQSPKGKENYVSLLTPKGYQKAFELFVEPGKAHHSLSYVFTEKGPNMASD